MSIDLDIPLYSSSWQGCFSVTIHFELVRTLVADGRRDGKESGIEYIQQIVTQNFLFFHFEFIYKVQLKRNS
jgi:hypothetical protein